MNKLYLITLDAEFDRASLISFLEKNNHINFWFFNMPNSFFVRSYLSAQLLSDKIRPLAGAKSYVVIQLPQGGNFAGFIPDQHATFFNNL